MKVLLHLADGFEEIEALSVVDILRRANITVKTVSITGKKEVLGAHDIPVLADELFENADYSKADMLVLPGGSAGAQTMKQHAGLEQQLKKAAADNKWIAAICAAPTVLGKLGMLNGKAATCYPGHEDELKGADTSLLDSVIIDGRIITSRGPGTSFDFAFALVEVLKGKELAAELKQKMIIC
jgi:4-methyl-5(b-hydroxyethyl)-thiazole monophosphate biosynthesis